MEDIPNYQEALPGISTGGQPDHDQLARLRDHGFQVVVNLGLSRAPYALDDEAAVVRSLGMEYFHIPVPFDAPGSQELRNFLAAMERCKGQKTFLHCALNQRVSCFFALYAELEVGWSREEADAFIARVWEPNETWREFLQTVRKEREAENGSAGSAPLGS